MSVDPDSRSASTGIEWAKGQPSPNQLSARGGRTPLTGSPSTRRSRPSALQRVGGGPDKHTAALARRLRPVLLGLVLGIVVVLSGFAIGRARQVASRNRKVVALIAPTAVRTPTPTVAEILDPLWQEVDHLWQQRAWQSAISVLERMYIIDPTDADVQTRLSSAHFRLAEELLTPQDVDEALIELNRAIRIHSGNEHLRRARLHLLSYSRGKEKYQQQDWDEAIVHLDPIFQDDPDYLDVGLMLYNAHYQRGLVLEQEDELLEAKEEYILATTVYPQGNEASARLALVTDMLRMRKRIEVDISEQRMRAYEKDQIVLDFILSSGKPGTPTKRGVFEVLDKIPQDAYSSAWGLRMPWWLGIYWAGGSENGFHALPILRNGRTLWAGYLGTPISYGCLVLDTPAAKRLYDWAEIGTMVIIRD